MKVRVLVPLVFAAILLLSGKAILEEMQPGTAQDVAADGDRHVTERHPRVAPPALPVPTAANAQSNTAGATVLIGSQGLDPAQVTIAVGQMVTWVNQTGIAQRLVSGEPFRIYVPLVLNESGNGSPSGSAQVAGAETIGWGSDVTPGGIYTRVFAEEGAYAYYVASHADWIGLVTVTTTAQTVRDVDEIVRGIRILASRTDHGEACQGASWSMPRWAYYGSEAFLDHGFGSSYAAFPRYELNGANRVIGYKVWMSDLSGSPHSFMHHLRGIPPAGNILYYTGTFTSTLYDSFFYTTTLSYSLGRLDSAVVIKDYGAGERYQIQLDIDSYSLYPVAKSYVATVNGRTYAGMTRTVDIAWLHWLNCVFCN